MDNNHDYYQNNPGFDLVLKKRRRKKNKKPKMTRHLVVHGGEDKSESETSNTIDSVGDPYLTDGSTGVEDTEEDSQKDDAISLSKVNRTLISDNDRVYLDSMMKAPPSVQPGECVNVIENSDLKTVDSADDKLAAATELVEENVSRSAQLINTRALHKDSSTYELEKFEKNALIIFNQVEISGHLPRLGTEKDVESLTNTFENLGFEVTPHDDLTKDELFDELKTFSEKDFTDYGCVAVAVLTHGSNNGLLRAKDQQYSEIQIINMFKDHSKPTLVTKPKIIIIQACRGTKIKPGMPVFHAGKIQMDHDEDLEPYMLPVESDLLILHSSYVGSTSIRIADTGSWFIQALCKNINSLASSYDLESIITVVKREVAIEKQFEQYNRRTHQMDVNKQMPVLTSTLIRKLYLRKFGEEVKQETHVDRSRQGNGSRPPSQSRHELLDAVTTPTTPMLFQYGPCSCFVDHFAYMKNCLTYFVEENPEDDTAKSFLGIANALEDGANLNTIDEMCKAISKHLHKNARSKDFYKYMYFYKRSH